MAAISDGNSNACTFLWKLENINRCWMRLGDEIKSPAFIADGVEGTKWSMGFKADSVSPCMCVWLQREKDSSGPVSIDVCYECTLQVKEVPILDKRIDEAGFEKNKKKYVLCLFNNEVVSTHKKEMLYYSDLIIQCTIWKKDETPVKPSHVSARTVWKINRCNFAWKINKLNCLKPGFMCQFKGDLVDFDLKFNEIIDNIIKLVINITSINETPKIFSFKISVINSKGEKEICGGRQIFNCDLKSKFMSIPFLVSTCTENRSRYLPNDELILDFEYALLYETVLLELQNCRIISPEMQTQVFVTKKYQNPSVLIEAMKSMFKDLIFSDVELRTSTQTFSAHKVMLSFESPVFKQMFSDEEEEKNTGHVDITDLDDDTVFRMLLCMYTDEVEVTQLDDTCNLYVAAHKYKIGILKQKCTKILMINLSVTNASRILLLADRHQDKELKRSVQDFILGHEKEVYRSKEWKDLMDSDILLAATVMYKKLIPVKKDSAYEINKSCYSRKRNLQTENEFYSLINIPW